jgi:hypothetical protein
MSLATVTDLPPGTQNSAQPTEGGLNPRMVSQDRASPQYQGPREDAAPSLIYQRHALSDDNKIRVEKIGSGNWYWSFPADEKKAKDAALEKAQEEYSKANATVTELQAKVDDAGAARAEDEDMLLETGQYINTAIRTLTNFIQVAIARR